MFCLFNKKSLGIDIADHRILVTRLKKSGGAVSVDSFDSIKLPSGVVLNGRIKNKEVLAKAISLILKNVKAESACEKRIVFGLPKNQVYVHVFFDESGSRSREATEQLVKKDISESIPLEANDIYYSYKILNKNQNKKAFLVVAVSKELIYEWQNFFGELGVDVQIYDLSSLATYRNLYKSAPKNPLCIIDMGGDSTSINVFNQNGLRYSHAIPYAGIKFSERIAAELKISFDEAEKLKIKSGITSTGKILPVIEKDLEPIIKTCNDIFSFIKKRTDDTVEKIVLVGASSRMKGLPEYFQSVFKIPVELGQPIITKGKAEFEYLNSIGLALRGFEKRSRQKDPGLLPLKKEKILKKNSEKNEKTLLKKEKIVENTIVDYVEIENIAKIKRQKILLLVIIFVGIILVGLSFWYRSYKVKQKQIIESAKILPFANQEIISLQIPIAVEKSEFAIDRVKGRITESIENDLASGERLWTDPVAKEPTRWLIYSETDAKALLLAKLKDDISAEFSLGE
ncbi:MAG: pilus assembly protein PilM, partial [Candidatus Magasanikbacteria bacterium]|nr:pilus assembly protein PilM [Candidatus Magasanikbacteria bacterium]